MLGLSRKVGQEILVGDAIKIIVTGIDPHRVRLAISAPAETLILRGELLERRYGQVASENEDAK
jgi:carbon storage regulator CsrA